MVHDAFYTTKKKKKKLSQSAIMLTILVGKCRINVNPSKCAHVTFPLRRQDCPQIKINNIDVPVGNQYKYLGVHLDRHLIWSRHMEAKLVPIKLKSAQMHWIIGSNSILYLEYKFLLYKCIMKPIWTYGIQLWGIACTSNVLKLQRRQSKLLRQIVCAPWYIRNDNIHRDLNIPTIQEEINASVN